MLSAELAEFFQLKPVRCGFFVLGCRIIPALALCAGKCDYVPHDLPFLSVYTARYQPRAFYQKILIMFFPLS